MFLLMHISCLVELSLHFCKKKKTIHFIKDTHTCTNKALNPQGTNFEVSIAHIIAKFKPFLKNYKKKNNAFQNNLHFTHF